MDVADHWIQREQELIKRHNEIIKRRQELLEETIKYTIDSRHKGELSEEDYDNMLNSEKYWFSKKVRNEKLLQEVNRTVERIEDEAQDRKNSAACTRLKIQKEIYWSHVNHCLPKWIQQVEGGEQKGSIDSKIAAEKTISQTQGKGQTAKSSGKKN